MIKREIDQLGRIVNELNIREPKKKNGSPGKNRSNTLSPSPYKP